MPHQAGEGITYIKCEVHTEQDMNEVIAVDPDNPANKIYRCPHEDHDGDFEEES
jgi:hypothetical protein